MLLLCIVSNNQFYWILCICYVLGFISGLYAVGIRIESSELCLVQYYIEPTKGHRFRSKIEVFRFLETGSKVKKKLDTDANVTVRD